MSRILCLAALALATAAATAQATFASDGKPVDPLAVGYLIGRGLSPSEVKSWTVGACSHATKSASCYAVLDRTIASAAGAGPNVRSHGPYPISGGTGFNQAVTWQTGSAPKVDPLAVSYLMGRGLSPSEIQAWTV